MRILNPNLALSQASVDEVINVSQNSEQLLPDSPEEEGDKIDIPTDSEIPMPMPKKCGTISCPQQRLGYDTLRVPR
jgi:hypothetical protein